MSDRSIQTSLMKGYGRLPLSFEVNKGHTDSRVKFLTRGRGYTLFLTGDEAVLSLTRQKQSRAGSFRKTGAYLFGPRPAALDLMSAPQGYQQGGVDPFSGSAALLFGPRTANLNITPAPQAPNRTSIRQTQTAEVLRLKLVGANRAAKVAAFDELPGKSNYFIGNDPKKWRTNVPNYAKVSFRGVYPGIDLVYYGDQGQLEYDFVVAPHANPKAIKLALVEAIHGSSLRIDGGGNLLIQAGGGEVRFRKPVVYQPVATFHEPQPKGGRTPSLQTNLESQTRSRKLVDGHYLLGADNQIAFEVASYDPTKPLVVDPVLSYSTYFGGGGVDVGGGLVVDASGSAYLTGETSSTDFPTTVGARDSTCGSDGACNSSSGFGSLPDAFVTKVNPTGTALAYSTYLGGSGIDGGAGIAVDRSGNAYVAGATSSTDFPTVNPLQQGCGVGPYDAFVTKLNSGGSALIYSTCLGGLSDDGASGIAVDASDNAYVAGLTKSPDFPTVHPLQTWHIDSWDVFVSKIDPAGSALVYSTYLGGSYNGGVLGGDDEATGITIDSSGSAYVTGFTLSTDFPTTAGAFQETCPSCSDWYDAFVSKLNPAGSALVYSTYLGGSYSDLGSGICVDGLGNAYVTGITASPDFPTTANAFQSSCNKCGFFSGAESYDSFVVKLDPTGSALVYSTFLGGSDQDIAQHLAVDTSGHAYVAGYTSSMDFPTAHPLQPRNAGGRDAFLSQLDASGSALAFSTYLGGSGDDGALGIALDRSRNIYITGSTTSTDFPAPNTLQGYGGSQDAFVAKILPLSQFIFLSAEQEAVPFAVFRATFEIEKQATQSGSGGLFSLGGNIVSPPVTAVVRGTFRLGAQSNGISPLAEVVELQIGTFYAAIPARSFTEQAGRFDFQGVVNRVGLKVEMVPLTPDEFGFTIEAAGVDLTDARNSLTLILAIGDDAGATVATEGKLAAGQF